MVRVVVSVLFVLLASGCSLFRPAIPRTIESYRAEAAEGALRAGVSVIDITPEETVYLGGYGILRESEAVHDPITCRALVLGRGAFEFVFVVTDLIGIQRGDLHSVREALRADGVDPRHVWIVATHNHSGPDTLGLWGFPPFVSGQSSKYMNRVRAAIVDAVREARANTQPAELATGSFFAPRQGWVKNLRRPGLVDREVAVLAVRGAGGGSPIATLVEFGCHPEVQDRDNHDVTSDFPHVFRTVVEEQLGGTAFYVSGALGGLTSPDIDDDGDLWAECTRVGEGLAAGTLEAVAKLGAYTAEPNLRLWQTPLFLSCENFGYHLLRFTGILDRKLFKGGYVETEVSLLELGPARWASVPGEITPDLGLRIKAAVGGDGSIAVVGLVNDEVGYLLPAWDFGLPLFSYERTLCVSRQAGVRVLERLTDLGLLARDAIREESQP